LLVRVPAAAAATLPCWTALTPAWADALVLNLSEVAADGCSLEDALFCPGKSGIHVCWSYDSIPDDKEALGDRGERNIYKVPQQQKESLF